MRRRDFIKAIAVSAAAWPLAARSQQTTMGFLHSGSRREWTHAVTAFHDGLKQAGYVEGQNVTIDYRWAEDLFDQLPTLAADMVSRRPSLIVVGGGSVAVLAAKRANSTIPLVFAIGGDPVKLGLVASFNRPGGNVTGATFLLNEMVAKRLELLRKLVPSANLIGVIVNPANPNAESDVRDVQDTARRLGLNTDVGNARNESELDAALDDFHQRRVGALILLPDPSFASRRNQIVALAARRRLPAMYFGREFATAGGLMSYSASLSEAYGKAGEYAGRILNGEKPADLPVVQPTKFEFVINLKTARALGLEVPPALLALADEVIE